ncbi:MAG TPA: hypothetical protein VLK23_06895 [Thermodesulfobacteriota bacterium]|nr:hypothetical protein [Thermodesulfobacteriota bacterium]
MGINGIHPIDPNCMDIRAFKQDYGQKVCVLGNVDVNTLSDGAMAMEDFGSDPG